MNESGIEDVRCGMFVAGCLLPLVPKRETFTLSDYLPALLNELNKKNYSFLSFEETLKDPLYSLKDKYYKKWGISWLYRWMENQKEVSAFLKQEPEGSIYPLYQKLMEEQKGK
jgi:hypothetical protein